MWKRPHKGWVIIKNRQIIVRTGRRRLDTDRIQRVTIDLALASNISLLFKKFLQFLSAGDFFVAQSRVKITIIVIYVNASFVNAVSSLSYAQPCNAFHYYVIILDYNLLLRRGYCLLWVRHNAMFVAPITPKLANSATFRPITRYHRLKHKGSDKIWFWIVFVSIVSHGPILSFFGSWMNNNYINCWFKVGSAEPQWFFLIPTLNPGWLTSHYMRFRQHMQNANLNKA